MPHKGQWKPGQSGNPEGRRVEKRFKDALKRKCDPERLLRVVEAMLKEAEAGNVNAIKELADRIDGKVPQAIVGDDEHPPVQVHCYRWLRDDEDDE